MTLAVSRPLAMGQTNMSDPTTFASLSPALLARKGRARPAMRRQLQPPNRYLDAMAQEVVEDLGWNDMGSDLAGDVAAGHPDNGHDAGLSSRDGAEAKAGAVPASPQQEQAADQSLASNSEPRPCDPVDNRRAAFTVRLNADRHLRLRLASVVHDRSAQQIVTEALDHYLAAIQGLEELACAAKRQN